MDVAAGAQSMPHQWTVAEGGREGGDDDPARHHQDRQQAAVKQYLTVWIFLTSRSFGQRLGGAGGFRCICFVVHVQLSL